MSDEEYDDDGGGDGYVELCSGWNNLQAITAHAGAIYLIDNGTLYRCDTAGEYEEVGDASWSNATAMVSVGGQLFIVDGGTLYRVDV